MSTLGADVLVLGAGPGGAAAAIMCARAGLRVALVERDAFPREHAGETLHPGVEPLLERLGVAAAVRAAGFLRHEGHWIEWGGARRFEPFGADEGGAWLGWQAWRADFDALLVAHARALGVAVLQPCRAVRPLVAGARVVGVETSAGPLVAPFVVDAAGGSHWLARQLKLPVSKYSRRLTARYGYAEGACAARDDAPSIVADARGWTWTARVRPGLYQWTRLSLAPGDAAELTREVKDEACELTEACAEEAAGGGADELAPGWLPTELRGLRPRGATRGADVTWRAVESTAGAGYFLCGDAAAVLDPASSHGVLKALMSGMMAAHQIALVRSGHSGEREAAARYSFWLNEWFAHDLARLRELYSVFGVSPGQARSPRALIVRA